MKAEFIFCLVVMLVGIVIGMVLYDRYICVPCDEGRAVIDAKEWHMERDSLIASRDSTAAVNALLLEKIRADSIAERRADSIAGVLATIRLERIARHDYRRYGHPELDSVIRSRYTYRNARE